MPEPFHLVPSLDHTAFNGVEFSGFGGLSSDISNIKVKGLSDFFITEHELLFADILGLGDEGGNVESGLHVASVSHFGIPGTVVDDYKFGIHLSIDLYAINKVFGFGCRLLSFLIPLMMNNFDIDIKFENFLN